MFGLEEYYEDLLNEAKSPEEIKKILDYKYVQGKGVPSDVLDAVFDIDPTKKKTYTSWVMNSWNSEHDFIKSLIKNGKLKKLFDYFKERSGSGLSLTDMPSVKQAYEMLPETDTVLEKNGNGGPEDDYEIVYDTPEWKIAVPNTYPAAEKLGKGCKWCTSGAFRDGEMYFNRYTAKGPLWINFKMNTPEICSEDKKEYPYTRYQFCFESGDFRNSRDNIIGSFSKIELPEDVRNFYAEQDEEYGKIIDNDRVYGANYGDDEEDEDFEERYDNYYEERSQHSHVVKEYNGSYLSLMTEYNDDYNFYENSAYFLYDEEDVTDPICYNEIDPDSEYIKEDFEGSSAVLVTDAGGHDIFCYLDSDHSYFDCDTYIDFFTKFDNFVVYIAGEHDYFSCFFLDTNKHLTTLKDDKMRGSEYVNMVWNRGLAIKGNDKERYDTEHIYLELIMESGYHELIKILHETSEIEQIISGDIPIGKFFEVDFKNGKPFIPTKNISYDSENKEFLNSFYLAARLNDRYCLVRIKSGGDNVYDIQKNQLLFSTPMKQILTLDRNFCDYICVKNEYSSWCLYSLKELKKISDSYASMRGENVDGRLIIWGGKSPTVYGDYSDVDIFEYKNNNVELLRQISSNGRIKVDDHNKVFIKQSRNGVHEMVECYGFFGNLILPESEIISFCHENNELMLLKQNGNKYLYSTNMRKVLLDNIEDWGRESSFYFFTNGEKSVISSYYYHNKIYFVDKVLCTTNDYAAVTINDRVFFIEPSIQYKTPNNGIPVSLIKEINSDNSSDGFFIITKDGARVGYYPHYNRKVGDQEAINKLFGNEINEIRDSFLRIFNRINEVIF